MSAENDGYTQPASSTRSKTYSPGREEFEILEAYNTLIKAGGRPVCPLGETNSISQYPGRYRSILGPWIRNPLTSSTIDWKDVFQQQLYNWQRFKAWQQSNRDIEDTRNLPLEESSDEGNYSPSRSGYISKSTKFEAHVAKAKRRLSHCGFTKSFTFDMDMGRQDEWTTWIEYMSFECYCCDVHFQHIGPTTIADLRPMRILDNTEDPPETEHGRFSEANEANSRYASLPSNINLNASLGNGRYNAHTTGKVLNYTDNAGGSHTRTRIRETSGSTFTSLDCGTSKPVKSAKAAGETQHAEHHNLILRWALLQEPEIAAKIVNSPRDLSAKGIPWTSIHGPRLKRNRDGSLCNVPRAACHDGTLSEKGVDDENIEHKRSRNRG